MAWDYDEVGLVVHKPLIEKIFDQKGYPSENRCIYCRSDPPNGSREHIIGGGLNGTLTIANATCDRCQGITRDIEQYVFRGHMRFFRLKEGFKTSHPKGAPVPVPVRIGNDPQILLKFAKSELPGIVIVPTMPPPKEIFGEWPSADSVELWHHVTDFGWPKDTATQIGPLNANMYGRMLAKIAHAYAVAEVGLVNLNPFLPEVILDANSDPFRYVGSWRFSRKKPTLKPDTDYNFHTVHTVGSKVRMRPRHGEPYLHRISLECWKYNNALYLVVQMRLLAYFGAPEFHVVAGIVSDIPKAAMRRAFFCKMASTASRQ